jgi:hypothetical protein
MQQRLQRRTCDRRAALGHSIPPWVPHPSQWVLPVALLTGVFLLCSAVVVQAQPANDDISNL